MALAAAIGLSVAIGVAPPATADPCTGAAAAAQAPANATATPAFPSTGGLPTGHRPPGANARAPLVLDVMQSPWPRISADGILCINMIHISPWEATLGLIKGAAAILPPGSPLYLYGPYIREGFATAPSNQAFDQNLRDRNPN